jgi:hypothetical protein
MLLTYIAGAASFFGAGFGKEKCACSGSAAYSLAYIIT